MHPTLALLSKAIDSAKVNDELLYKFALLCIEDVATNLEEESAVDAYYKFKNVVMNYGDHSKVELERLASKLKTIAASHQGSKSIDGTRHAAVSATYALAKAVDCRVVDAAAYAAYSKIYGYGGYAVNDSDSFAEVHEHQLDMFNALIASARHTLTESQARQKCL